jgi:hypothetical protein
MCYYKGGDEIYSTFYFVRNLNIINRIKTVVGYLTLATNVYNMNIGMLCLRRKIDIRYCIQTIRTHETEKLDR